MLLVLSMIILGLEGATDTDRLVKAIEMVENTPWSHPGGGLQFTAQTWREETKEEYAKANNRQFAREIAAQRLTKLIRRVRALGIEPTPYLLGSMWNKGFTGALRLKNENRHDDYGKRVQNCFEAYTKH